MKRETAAATTTAETTGTATTNGSIKVARVRVPAPRPATFLYVSRNLWFSTCFDILVIFWFFLLFSFLFFMLRTSLILTDFRAQRSKSYLMVALERAQTRWQLKASTFSLTSSHGASGERRVMEAWEPGIKRLLKVFYYKNADFSLLTLIFLGFFLFATLFPVCKPTVISKEMKHLNAAFEWFISGFLEEGVAQLNYSICQKDLQLGHLLCGMFNKQNRLELSWFEEASVRQSVRRVRDNWSRKYYWFRWQRRPA